MQPQEPVKIVDTPVYLNFVDFNVVKYFFQSYFAHGGRRDISNRRSVAGSDVADIPSLSAS